MIPRWLRVNPAIRSFILGEVERQWHPIGTMEYAARVEWMTDAWMWALNKAEAAPTIEDMLHVATMIEPDENRYGYRTVPVWIGGHEAEPWNFVPELVKRLWSHIDDLAPMQGRSNPFSSGKMTADDFYLEFEAIHPFRDGNGRTGKILHNWLLGTLWKPVLIHDYFGGGNP